MLDLARINAPASRSLRTWKASLGGIDPFNDSEPAEVGMSTVLKLSLTITGTQCSGPAKLDCAYLASRASATARAFGLTMMIALRAGPFLVVRLDAVDIQLDQLTAGQLPRFERSVDVRDRCF